MFILHSVAPCMLLLLVGTPYYVSSQSLPATTQDPASVATESSTQSLSTSYDNSTLSEVSVSTAVPVVSTTPAIVNTSVDPQSVEVLYGCSFDSDLCSWTQDGQDGVTWERQSALPGSLLSDSSGSGSYLYAKPSVQPGNSTGQIKTPYIVNPRKLNSPRIQYCLDFWFYFYHNSQNTGSEDSSRLNIYLQSYANGVSPANVSEYLLTTIYSSSSFQVSWKKQFTRLWLDPLDDGFAVIFEGFLTEAERSVLAIDDVNILPCDGIIEFCTFEDGYCGWTQIWTDNFNWRRTDHPTVTEGTGPVAGYNGGGHFLYIEATGRYPNAKAQIQTKEISSNSQHNCLIFRYHMYGNNIGKLEVKVNGSWILFSKLGDQGNEWKEAQVEILLPSRKFETFKLTFEASVGNGPLGDIAIDDMFVLRRECPGPVTVPSDFDEFIIGDTSGGRTNSTKIRSPGYPHSLPIIHWYRPYRYKITNLEDTGYMVVTFTDWLLDRKDVVVIHDYNSSTGLADNRRMYNGGSDGLRDRPNIVSTSNCLLVTILDTASGQSFVSHNNSIAFKGNVIFMSGNIPRPTMPKSCGEVFDKYSGNISLKLTSRETNISRDCVWVIKSTPPYTDTVLTGPSQILLPGSTIRQFMVRIHDGVTSDTPYLDYYSAPNNMIGMELIGHHGIYIRMAVIGLNGHMEFWASYFKASHLYGVYHPCPDYRNMFRCEDGLMCIPYSLYCDGTPQCRDRSDEYNCSAWCLKSTSTNYRVCHGSQSCVHVSALCDHNWDCADGYDEKYCSYTASTTPQATPILAVEEDDGTIIGIALFGVVVLICLSCLVFAAFKRNAMQNSRGSVRSRTVELPPEPEVQSVTYSRQNSNASYLIYQYQNDWPPDYDAAVRYNADDGNVNLGFQNSSGDLRQEPPKYEEVFHDSAVSRQVSSQPDLIPVREVSFIDEDREDDNVQGDNSAILDHIQQVAAQSNDEHAGQQMAAQGDSSGGSHEMAAQGNEQVIPMASGESMVRGNMDSSSTVFGDQAGDRRQNVPVTEL
ncbi:uncharacterized protein LOC106170068 [Lingula anatina]|uniref:Uncharacterized protein LOC106170068 n=1 Tax=Lingula anatina TaxID=7574 RepID=A0A1S3J4P1_LINAN|nr:uncharacterized protein LOC106170068 [Lingula anatina]|eukprot:XP_013405248.1 uncharacterized protein LOC106170068 [Lingula anatina]